MAERMSEMEAESLAKMVDLEGELVELRKQKEELENVNSQVSTCVQVYYFKHIKGSRMFSSYV